MMRKFKDLVKRIVFHFIKPPVADDWNSTNGKISYSQAGEDLILKYLFDSKRISNPTFLEIGTNHPFLNNNTYLLYLRGSRGVCIEADETLISEIARVRPEDKVLNIGVSISEAREADFYIFNDSGLNTFDKPEAEYRQSFGTYAITKVSKVRLETINNLIRAHFPRYPDLISIDIEGLDLAVLKTVDWAEFPIPVICTETCTYSENHVKPKDGRISEYMDSIGYTTYADTYINTIYINKKWFGI
jgi:FkbM family methyltransferase